MSSSPVTVRTRKFLANVLLQRRQMVIDVLHPNRANVSRNELQERLAEMLRVKDPRLVIVFGMRTKFGGARSTGFCVVYDNMKALKQFEPKYRQVRQKVIEVKETSRKQIKEAKNKGKKVWGVGRRAARHKAKKAEK